LSALDKKACLKNTANAELIAAAASSSKIHIYGQQETSSFPANQ